MVIHGEDILPIVKFETSMLKSCLCDYSDAYILFSRTITTRGMGDDAAARQVD